MHCRCAEIEGGYLPISCNIRFGSREPCQIPCLMSEKFSFSILRISNVHYDDHDVVDDDDDDGDDDDGDDDHDDEG